MHAMYRSECNKVILVILQLPEVVLYCYRIPSSYLFRYSNAIRILVGDSQCFYPMYSSFVLNKDIRFGGVVSQYCNLNFPRQCGSPQRHTHSQSDKSLVRECGRMAESRNIRISCYLFLHCHQIFVTILQYYSSNCILISDFTTVLSTIHDCHYNDVPFISIKIFSRSHMGYNC